MGSSGSTLSVSTHQVAVVTTSSAVLRATSATLPSNADPIAAPPISRQTASSTHENASIEPTELRMKMPAVMTITRMRP